MKAKKTLAAVLAVGLSTSVQANDLLKQCDFNKNWAIDTPQMYGLKTRPGYAAADPKIKDIITREKKCETDFSILQSRTSAEQEINKTWENHPEFEKYQALEKAWKAKEALELKQKIIREITNMVLKDYIKDFQDNYEEKMNNKINQFPEWLKTLLADFYDRWKKLLRNPSENDNSKFVYSIYSFVDSIDKSKWTSEKIAMELEQKFPELKGTNYMNLLISIWKNSDVIVKENKKQKETQEKIDEWNKIIEKLKRL